MSQTNQTDTVNNSNEITVKDLIIKIKSGIKYLKSRWRFILIFAIAGSAIGLLYAFEKKTTYTAVSTFVLEDNSKQGLLGQYAGIASLAGVDIGVGSGGGIFQGDNILELYKSRLMIQKALLTEVNIDGKNQLLIDRFISANRLREQWSKNAKIGNISFSGDATKFNRIQDSLIIDIVDLFNKEILSVNKPDKKLSIIAVSVTTNDELFSKLFADNIVETVNNFYVQTKTKNAAQNVQLLQKQADSLRIVLNSSLSGVAAAIDAAPNANPAMLSLRVPSQKKQIDVQSSTAIYSEVIKNLEISKMSLRQETPLIQKIDEPILPLEKNHIGKIKGLFVGLILGFFLSLVYLSVSKIYNKILS